jgi:uncharacterized protein (DUF1697 family)
MASGKPIAMVALLRGINVGTAKRISMADLKALVEELGYRNVRTLLNSGNVVFTGTPGADPVKVAARIERALEPKTGVSSRVTVITAAEVAHAVEKNPHGAIATDHSRLLVAVAADASLWKPFLALTQPWDPEAVVVSQRFAWVWSPNGTLESKVLGLVNKVLKDAVTVRNFATMIKLDAMCRTVSAG